MSEMDARQLHSPLIDASLNALASRSSAFAPSLKRTASSSFEGCEGEQSRKRLKEDKDQTLTEADKHDSALPAVSPSIVDDMARELECGCCSALVYRPVLVNPCQHFFCGRFTGTSSSWRRALTNGGTNCPACRGLSTFVTPFRALQSVVDAFVRAAPHKARPERERQQADEVYKAGLSMRIPPPREPSPEASVEPPTDFARPCPHCVLGNIYGWRCPQPIVDPTNDIDHAWHLDDGLPPGHAHCGNCVQNRCIALSLLSQQPHGLSDLGDLIMSADVYECFDSNTVEVEIMLDYLTTQRMTPRHIYQDIVNHISSQPRGFKAMMDLDLFTDIHGVAPGVDSDPEAPRVNTCRHCATEIFLWGLRDWWVRERQKGFLEESVTSRKDCPEGRACQRQAEHKEPAVIPTIEEPPSQPLDEPQSSPNAELAPSVPLASPSTSSEPVEHNLRDPTLSSEEHPFIERPAVAGS
ncbi:hypothetical protein H0H93_010975 [Arthromyces matolae]|nr:hypothetical protein H0H93_010975 [Arthromyces matolae]